MRAEPREKLNPRIKAVWRISDTLMLTAAWLILALPGAIALLVDASEAYWAEPYVLALTVLYAVLLVVFLFAVTPLRYIRFLGTEVRHQLAQAHRGSFHPCAEYRHEAGSHFARIWPGKCDGFNCCGIDGNPWSANRRGRQRP